MTSQLASQLKVLAAASTTTSSTTSSSSSTVRHPSLLFTPQLAADTSIDQIYQLAINGLTQLTALSPTLQPFAASLYHPATLTLDRAAQKPDVQAQLDKSITLFLTRLAPHFSHPAAAQALEWLVRRYEVHRYNAGVIVEQLLCWHQSDLFRRLLTLLKLPSSHFLLSVQAAGVTVDRHTIVTGAQLDAGLWEMIARVTRAQPHSAQLGLYVTVGIELLSSQKASDTLLTATIPHLLTGLSLTAHHNLNYHAATLILLVTICDTHTLDTDIIRALLTALTAPLSRDVSALSATLHTLAAVVASQRVEQLGVDVVGALVHAKGVVSAMSEVVKTREGELLLRTLLLSMGQELVEATVSQAGSALLSPSFAATAAPMPTSPALTPLNINTSAEASTASAVATTGRSRPTFTELHALLRQLLTVLPAASTSTATALLTELFDHSIIAAHHNNNQLPTRLITALREVIDTIEVSIGRSCVDGWITNRKNNRTQRETRRDLTDYTTTIDSHTTTTTNDEPSTNNNKRRKTHDGASANTADAEADNNSEDEAADERKVEGRKRKRSRTRRSVLQLGQSEAAVGSHLLAHVTKGTRHAFSIARDGESGEDGAMRLSVWQCVWSEDEDERKRGLSALQKLQKASSSSSSSNDTKNSEGTAAQPQFSTEQVESIIDDTLHSDNPTLINHLLSLTTLLTSLPSNSLSTLLLRLLDRHTEALAEDTAAGTGTLGVAHRKEQQRVSRAILTATFTFLAATFLPTQPQLLATFLPYYLEHAMINKATAKLNSHVRTQLSALHRLSPLLLHLPSTTPSLTATAPASSSSSSSSSGSSGAVSIEDDNQRLVELMSKNVIKDNSSSQQLLQQLLDVMDQPDGRGLLAAGLVLNLVFELRSERSGGVAAAAAAKRGKGSKSGGDDGDATHLRRFFTAISRHLQRLSALSGADASAAQPPASYFSAQPAALPAFLRYLLDRLIVSLPPLSTADKAHVHWSSTAAQLIYDVFVFLASVQSSAMASLYNAHTAHLLLRHLPSSTAQLDLVVRCVLPPPSSSVPLLVSVRAVQLLSSLLPVAGGADFSAVLSAVPLALCAMGHWSRAVRQAAVILVETMTTALGTAADKSNTKNETTLLRFQADEPTQPHHQPAPHRMTALSSSLVRLFVVLCRQAHAARQLLSVVLAEREECVADPAVLHRLVGSFFTPHSSLSSLSTAATASFARSLLTSASTTTHRPLTGALLTVMSRVPAVYVLDVADALLSGVLDDAAADDVSLSIASHVLNQLTVESMAASERGADWFVSLLTRALASPVAAVQRLALTNLTPALFAALPAAEQSSLFAAVLRFHFETTSTAVRDLASSTLRALPVSASVYLPSLEAAPAQIAHGETEALTGVLDLLSASQSLTDSRLLLRPLMAALSSLQQLESTSDGIQYAEQSVLSCLLLLLPRLRAADVKAAQLDLTVIVACLTATQTSSAAIQTRNTALQLLSALAPLIPTTLTTIIHTLITQLTTLPLNTTDSYAFTIVRRTVEQVLPPLLPAGGASGSELVKGLLAALVGGVVLDATTAAAILELLCVTLRTVGSTYLHDVLQLLMSKSVKEEATSSRLSEKRAKRKEEKKLKKKQKPSASNTANLNKDSDDSTTTPFDYSAFAHSLLDQFTPLEQSQELAQLLSTVLAAAAAAGGGGEAGASSVMVLSDDEKRRWVVRSLQLVASHLIHLPFVSSLLDLTDDETTAVHAQYEPMFTSLFALHTNNSQQLYDASADDTTTTAHYRAVEAVLQSALSHLTNLLSVASFVRLSSSLLKNTDTSVPKQALALLQSKLTWLSAQHQDRAATASTGQQAVVEQAVEQERDELTTLVAPLSELVSFDQSQEQQAQLKVHIVLAQLALACLQSLVITVCAPLPFRSQSDLAASHLAARRQLLLVVFTAVAAHFESSSAALSSSALLCAAAMIDQLRVAVLPHLPTFLPRALTIAQQAATSATSSRSSATLLSALTVVNVSIEQLPAFISPYLPAIIQLFMQPALHTPDANSEISQLIQSSVGSLIALLTPDTLLPHLSTAYKSAIKLGPSSLAFFFSLLAQLVARLSPDSTRQHLKPLFRLYQTAFTLRTTPQTATTHLLTPAQLDAIENVIVSGYIQLTLKLTEQQMKACLLRLIEWVGSVQVDVVGDATAAAGKGALSAVVAKGGLERGLVLFKVVAAMAEKLKSIFVPYYAFVFDHGMAYINQADNMQQLSTQHANSNSDDDSMDESAEDGESAADRSQQRLVVYNQLTTLILSSLRTTLSHDTQHFFGKEHLDRLVPALSTLLPATYQLTTQSSYTQWVAHCYTPLCVQLCVTLSHFHHWKPLHSALLTTSRSPVAAVRLAVVDCMLGLFEGLQARYLVMLPETLPYVSEWLEDEDEEVERRVQRLVKVIEDLSGEKLDRYLEG